MNETLIAALVVTTAMTMASGAVIAVQVFTARQTRATLAINTEAVRVAAKQSVKVVAEQAEKTDSKLDGIHVLLDGNITREKVATLVANKALLVSLKRLPDPDANDRAAIDALVELIADLEKEIENRRRTEILAQLAQSTERKDVT